MNRHPIHVILLGTIATLSPAILLAQDPMAPSASQTQPNQPRQVPPSATSMQDSSTGVSSNSPQMMQDKMFLRKAGQGGLAEVQLGQLALQKAGSQDVKDFGQKMVTDHTALNKAMAKVADSMGVMMPKKLSKEAQAEYDKLNAMSGDGFDKEYLAYMVKDHHQDLREFRIESSSASDPALKAAVEKGVKVIEEHTKMVEKLAKD